jgi:hypothetical protein
MKMLTLEDVFPPFTPHSDCSSPAAASSYESCVTATSLSAWTWSRAVSRPRISPCPCVQTGTTSHTPRLT